MGLITVVGLGPAGPELVTLQTADVLGSSAPIFLRTRRHPAAVLVPGSATSFDDLYESESSFDAVYRGIVSRLLEAAHGCEEVIYAVPGSPAVAEHTVELLLDQHEVQVRLLPALSFADLAWTQLRIDPLRQGVRIVDGRRFAIDAASERGPLLVAQCDQLHVLSDIKLSVDVAPSEPIIVLQRLGTKDEYIGEVAWDDLDRAIEPDHLTSLYIPRLQDPIGAEYERFAELVRRLRAECPWDAEQTHESLRRHLLEETYEVLEAIDAVTLGHDGEDDGYGDLEEELGDLLFQVFFHATLAAEQGQFTIADVARTVYDKLYERHPHVFGDGESVTAEELVGTWEQNKLVEKGRGSVMDGIPKALPALLLALKSQKKAAALGFGVDATYRDVVEELARVQHNPAEAEIGDLIFAAVGIARLHGVDPETAASRSAATFQARFRLIEDRSRAEGVTIADAGDARVRQWWTDAKRELSDPRHD